MVDAKNVRAATTEQQFGALYRAHYKHIYRYFIRRTDVESSRDGTAETFFVAWRRFKDVPDGDSALPWLYGVARRVLANQWRSRRRRDRLRERLTLFGAEHDVGPETVVVRPEHIQDVLDAMARLRDGDREVLRLAEWEELSHKEIGEVLGCTAHAVDQRLHRAMRRLGRELGSAGSSKVDGEGGAR